MLANKGYFQYWALYHKIDVSDFGDGIVVNGLISYQDVPIDYDLALERRTDRERGIDRVMDLQEQQKGRVRRNLLFNHIFRDYPLDGWRLIEVSVSPIIRGSFKYYDRQHS